MKNIDYKKEFLTIPNLLSLFRLLLIPVYVYLYFRATTPWDYYLCAAILAVSCLTDLADGYIARHFNMISHVGKILDPVADKATQLAMVICLAIRYPVLWWMLGILAVKELYQLIAMYVFAKKKLALNGARFSGKIATTVLFVSLIAIVMFNPSQSVVFWINLMDCAFLLGAFLDYFCIYTFKKYEFEDLSQYDGPEES